jgi:hypothetical protein
LSKKRGGVKMGYNCFGNVASLEEGKRQIKKGIKSAPACLQVSGDAIILDTRTSEEFIFKIIQTQKQFEKQECTLKLTNDGKFNPILPTIASCYGKKPTEDKPFVFMLRFE